MKTLTFPEFEERDAAKLYDLAMSIIGYAWVYTDASLSCAVNELHKAARTADGDERKFLLAVIEFLNTYIKSDE